MLCQTSTSSKTRQQISFICSNQNIFLDGWLDVSANVDKYIEWNLVENPIQIKTSSIRGSKDVIGIDMYKNNKWLGYFGGIGVEFGHTFKYWLDGCSTELKQEDYTEFPVQPTIEVDKIWTFTITETSVMISCNGVEHEPTESENTGP